MVVPRPPWLLVLLVLAARAGSAGPMSPSANAGVAGGAGGAELAALADREEAAPTIATEAGTIREALGGGVVEPARPMGPPGGLRNGGSRCGSPQMCIRVDLCPSVDVNVLFECGLGKVCCVPASSEPPRPRPPNRPVSSSQQPQHFTSSPYPQWPVTQPNGFNPQPHQPASMHPQTQPFHPQPQLQPTPHYPQTQPTSHRPHPQPTTYQPAPEQHAPQKKVPRPTGQQENMPQGPESLLPDTNVCGKVLTENRITNGKIASMGQFPWMALLGYRSRGSSRTSFLCGGTLINDKYVLTAAHCFTSQSTPVSIRLGEFNLTEPIDCDHNKVCAPPPQDIAVDSYVIHPDFDFRSIKHDIALIRLQRSVPEYSDFIRPICLPTTGLNVTDERKFKIAGWGKTDFKNVGGSPVLQFTDVNGLGHAECNELQPPELRPLEPGQLCAGGDKGKDACKGDSGGPLMVTLAINPPEENAPPSHVTYQIGVVSYGPDSPCGTAPLPSIYTRVASYVPWILATLRS